MVEYVEYVEETKTDKIIEPNPNDSDSIIGFIYSIIAISTCFLPILSLPFSIIALYHHSKYKFKTGTKKTLGYELALTAFYLNIVQIIPIIIYGILYKLGYLTKADFFLFAIGIIVFTLLVFGGRICFNGCHKLNTKIIIIGLTISLLFYWAILF